MIRDRKRKFQVAFAVFALVEVVVVAEVFYRFISPISFYATPADLKGDHWHEFVHVKSETPGLIYELAPNVSISRQVADTYHIEVNTNSYGMRDAEPLPMGREGVFRIVALGDSFTFGWGVSKGEQTFPSVLEKLLNESEAGRKRVFDSLNFSVSGYSTTDETAVLKHKGMRWNPDLVLVGYFFNDPEQEPFGSLRCMYTEPRWWQYLYVGRALAWHKYQWDVRRFGGDNYFRYLHADGRREWQSVLDSFAEMRRLTEPRDIPVVVVIFPEPPADGWENYLYADLHEKVARAATDAGLYAVDLLETFSSRDPAELRLLPEDHHPTAKAHRLAACAVLDKVRDLFPDISADSAGCSPQFVNQESAAPAALAGGAAD